MNRNLAYWFAALSISSTTLFGQDTSTIRWRIDPTYPPLEAKVPDDSLALMSILATRLTTILMQSACARNRASME